MELRGVSVCPDNLSVISVAIDNKIEAIVNEGNATRSIACIPNPPKRTNKIYPFEPIIGK